MDVGKGFRVVRVVLLQNGEVAYAIVGETRFKVALSKSGDAVAQLQLNASKVRRSAGRRGKLRPRRRSGQRRQSRTLDGIVGEHLDLYVLRKSFNLSERAVFGVEAIRQTECSFELIADEREIVQQQRSQIDQKAVSFGMRLTLDLR